MSRTPAYRHHAALADERAADRSRCMAPVTYVLPIRRTESAVGAELNAYLHWIAQRAELIVVDGSPPAVFEEHAKQWGEFCRHLPPDSAFTCRNGKVRGVLTGLSLAAHDRIVIADDDVRYDERSLAEVVDLLDRADLVAPQNYFDPAPWHAIWDTARSLINRAFGADSPGTLAVRRSALSPHGYDGDVLFENLELMRTVVAAGGRVATPIDCYVRRLPPTAAHFASQRVRQAYDEFARPPRLLAALCVVPGVALLCRSGHPRYVIALGGLAMALATVGRSRGDGSNYFARSAVLFAPLWVAERGVCAWVALWCRLRGGCSYSSNKIKIAAHSTRHLRAIGAAA